MNAVITCIYIYTIILLYCLRIFVVVYKLDVVLLGIIYKPLLSVMGIFCLRLFVVVYKLVMFMERG